MSRSRSTAPGGPGSSTGGAYRPTAPIGGPRSRSSHQDRTGSAHFTSTSPCPIRGLSASGRVRWVRRGSRPVLGGGGPRHRGAKTVAAGTLPLGPLVGSAQVAPSASAPETDRSSSNAFNSTDRPRTSGEPRSSAGDGEARPSTSTTTQRRDLPGAAAWLG